MADDKSASPQGIVPNEYAEIFNAYNEGFEHFAQYAKALKKKKEQSGKLTEQHEILLHKYDIAESALVQMAGRNYKLTPETPRYYKNSIRVEDHNDPNYGKDITIFESPPLDGILRFLEQRIEEMEIETESFADNVDEHKAAQMLLEKYKKNYELLKKASEPFRMQTSIEAHPDVMRIRIKQEALGNTGLNKPLDEIPQDIWDRAEHEIMEREVLSLPPLAGEERPTTLIIEDPMLELEMAAEEIRKRAEQAKGINVRKAIAALGTAMAYLLSREGEVLEEVQSSTKTETPKEEKREAEEARKDKQPEEKPEREEKKEEETEKNEKEEKALSEKKPETKVEEVKKTEEKPIEEEKKEEPKKEEVKPEEKKVEEKQTSDTTENKKEEERTQAKKQESKQKEETKFEEKIEVNEEEPQEKQEQKKPEEKKEESQIIQAKEKSEDHPSIKSRVQDVLNVIEPFKKQVIEQKEVENEQKLEKVDQEPLPKKPEIPQPEETPQLTQQQMMEKNFKMPQMTLAPLDMTDVLTQIPVTEEAKQQTQVAPPDGSDIKTEKTDTAPAEPLSTTEKKPEPPPPPVSNEPEKNAPTNGLKPIPTSDYEVKDGQTNKDISKELLTKVVNEAPDTLVDIVAYANSGLNGRLNPDFLPIGKMLRLSDEIIKRLHERFKTNPKDDIFISFDKLKSDDITAAVQKITSSMHQLA